jgi:hypothetical protein
MRAESRIVDGDPRSAGGLPGFLPLTHQPVRTDQTVRVKIKNSSGDCMEEDLLDSLLDPLFRPVGMLLANRGGLEAAGRPVETEGGAQFLFAAQAAQRRDIRAEKRFRIPANTSSPGSDIASAIEPLMGMGQTSIPVDAGTSHPAHPRILA